MDTSYLRDQLAQHVAGEVYDGPIPRPPPRRPRSTPSSTHRPAVVVAARSARGRRGGRARGRPTRASPVTVQATGHGAAAPAEGTVFVSTRRDAGPARRPGHPGRAGRGRRAVAPGDRRRRTARAGPAVGVVVGRRRRRLHAGRRDGPPRAPSRLRRRPRARRPARDGRGRAHDGHRRRATRSCSGPCVAARAASGSSPPIEFGLVPVPRFAGGALFFTGADIEPALRAFGAWAPTLPEEATTSVALLRLPPVDDVPPPLRGTVSLALRFGFAGSAESAACWRRCARSPTPVLGGVGPMPYAEVDRHPHGPAGADAGGHPRRRC